MHSLDFEGVLAETKHSNKSRAEQYVRSFFKKHKDKFTPEAFTGKVFDYSSEYIRRLQASFLQLRADLFRLMSLVQYRISIDFDFLFHLAFGIYRLVCYDNKVDLCMTLVFVARTFLGNKVAQFSDIVCNWCDTFIRELKSYGRVSSEALPEFLQKVSAKHLMDTMLNSNLIKSIRELVLNLVGLKFFDKERARQFIAVLGPPRPVSLIDLGRNIIETVEEFIQFGVNYSKTGSFMQALHRDDPTLAFLEKTYILTLQISNVYIGDDINFSKIQARHGGTNPSELGANYIASKDFIFKLRTAILEGKEISSRISKTPLAFKARMYALEDMLSELTKKTRSKNRRAPFGIIIHGDPSIGKSSLCVHIYKTHCKYRGLEYSRDLVYDRNPKSSYWTNHDPLSQPIIHYPELGSTASNIVKTKGDECVDEMLLVADTQPFSAEMAEVDQKGKCMIMPDLLVVDCNDPKMNLEYTNNNPAAIRRRFLYIEAKVKPEYANGTALDERKIPEDLEHKMDLWNFNVYRQLPNGIKKSEIVPIGSNNMDIFGLTQTLIDEFEKHDHRQDGFGKAVDESIDKYLQKESIIKSESDSNSLITRENFMLLMFIFISWYIGPAACSFVSFIYQLYAYLNVEVCPTYGTRFNYLKMRLAVWISCYLCFSRINHFFSEMFVCFNVTTSFLYEFGLSFFVKDRARYYETKMRFNNLGVMGRFSLSLLVFSFTLLIVKIAFSCFHIGHSILSEGTIIESSGEFTESNVDDELKKREEKSSTAFPEAKKKSGNDMDYDVVENTYPRYVSEEKNKKDPDQIYNSVLRNVRYLIVTYKGKSFKTHGVGLKGDMMLLNKHVIIGDGTQIVSSCKKEYSSNIKNLTVDLRDVAEVGDDLVLIRFYGELFKDITYLLTDVKPCSITMECRFAGQKNRVKYCEDPLTVTSTVKDYVLQNSLFYIYELHENGTCGTPLMIVVNNQCFLAGLHSGGADSGGQCYATIVNKTPILKALNDKFAKDFLSNINSEGSLRLPKGKLIDSVTPRSPLLFEATPGLGVIGSISNYAMITPKSRLLQSPLIKDIESLVGMSAYGDNGEPRFLPPMMKHVMRHGNYISPLNIWTKKVGVVKKSIDANIMRKTVISVSAHLLSQLKQQGITSVHPFPLAVAQNGYPLNFYIRAMRNSTSGGFLLPGKKSRYNTKVALDFKEDAVMPDYEVKEQVLELLRSYENDEISHEIVGAQLKDEPRSYNKATSGNTRIFAMSSYASTLVNRMYLMPFYTLMVEHRDIFCTKVGINMHSEEAGAMYDDLVNFSPFIMEGDYGGYDTSMPVGIGLMANSVVETMLKRLSYNEYSMQIVRGILSDNLYPTLALEGNLFVAAGFQPSGKYATAEDNSLRGLLLLHYAYLAMCTEAGLGHEMNLTTEFKVGDFFKWLKPVTYGDDMLCAVKPEIAQYFNNILYSVFVEQEYGMQFTNADKTAHVEPFINADKMSFLKRSFIYNKLLDRRVAVLDKESLVKSLSYILPSKDVSIYQQLVETCVSALREYFFYCETLEEYNSKRQQFINVLLERIPESYTKEDFEKLFPFGENLLEMYRKRPDDEDHVV